MSNKTVCILLAEGFEEVEALMPADIFRRLDVNVILAGIENKKIRGAHGFTIMTETSIEEIDATEFDALMIPGGLPGTINLRNSEKVNDLINLAYNNGKICAAICAAPIVLVDAGIARGKKITGYPDSEQLSHNPNFRFSGADVEVDGRIITAKGMGKAAPFAVAIAKAMGIDEKRINGVLENAFIEI